SVRSSNPVSAFAKETQTLEAVELGQTMKAYEIFCKKDTPRSVEALRDRLKAEGADTRTQPPWTAEDEAALLEGVKAYGKDFATIREKCNLANRTESALVNRLRIIRKAEGADTHTQPPWTAEDEAALLEGVKAYGKDFATIREKCNLANRTEGALDKRLRTIRKAEGADTHTQPPWTAEDEAALLEGVKAHGRDFATIREKCNLANRTEGALREHFRQYEQQLRAAEPLKITESKNGRKVKTPSKFR
ncbi:hypothetical protein TrCOL_g49, partial [Triparma columacea]